MRKIVRHSPIDFHLPAIAVSDHCGWQVVSAYQGQGQGPHLIDLSHRPCWDIQGSSIAELRSPGLEIPDVAGAVSWTAGRLMGRLNATQCRLWQLGPDGENLLAGVHQATEITDGQACLLLIGSSLSSLMELLTPLEIFPPDASSSWLYQGPLLDLPSQIVRLAAEPDLQAVLISMPRGYGQTMAQTILDIGREHGLKPAGEEIFTQCLGFTTIEDKNLQS